MKVRHTQGWLAEMKEILMSNNVEIEALGRIKKECLWHTAVSDTETQK